MFHRAATFAVIALLIVAIGAILGYLIENPMLGMTLYTLCILAVGWKAGDISEWLRRML